MSVEMLYNTGRFVMEAEFGDRPRRIFIISFLYNFKAPASAQMIG